MSALWSVAGAAAGLVVGAASRGPVFRLSVPYGEPDRRCPACGGAVGPFGRCCGRLGPPLVPEVLTAAVLGLLAWRFAGRVELAAFAVLGVLGVALALIDIAVERLPDRLTLPAYPLVLGLLGVAAAVHGEWSDLGRAVLGSLVLSGTYVVLAVLRPGQLGWGDVKLAAVLGLVLGWLGWPVLVIGSALAYVLFGVIGLVLLVARRVKLDGALSFGPFMLVGALVAVLL